jgi:hypothetical protein
MAARRASRWAFDGDPVEPGLECGFGERALHHQADRPPVLVVQPGQRPAQQDRLGLGDGRAPVALAGEIIEDVTRIAQPALEVSPDDRLEGLGPDHRSRAATEKRSPIPVPATAAVPADALLALRADIGQEAFRAVDHAPQDIRPGAVLHDPAVASQGLLGRPPRRGSVRAPRSGSGSSPGRVGRRC